MPILPGILLSGALLALSAGAAAQAIPSPAGRLQLRFVALEPATRTIASDQSVLDIGTVAAKPRRISNAIVVRQRIGVRLEGAQANARLSVMLADPGVGTLRVDGMPVSTVPRVIDPAHRVGATVTHEIELTIPPEVPPGPFLGNLQWLAETD